MSLLRFTLVPMFGAVLGATLPVNAQTITSVDPASGTVGSVLTIEGDGFGDKKPKVFLQQELPNGKLKKHALKVVELVNEGLVIAELKKTPPAGDYTLVVQPKGKGAEPGIAPNPFTIHAPANIIPDKLQVEPNEELTLTAEHLGSKKGKVSIYDGKTSKGKVLEWDDGSEAESQTGSVRFRMPKKIPNGPVSILVETKHGTSASGVTVEVVNSDVDRKPPDNKTHMRALIGESFFDTGSVFHLFFGFGQTVMQGCDSPKGTDLCSRLFVFTLPISEGQQTPIRLTSDNFNFFADYVTSSSGTLQDQPYFGDTDVVVTILENSKSRLKGTFSGTFIPFDKGLEPVTVVGGSFSSKKQN